MRNQLKVLNQLVSTTLTLESIRYWNGCLHFEKMGFIQKTLHFLGQLRLSGGKIRAALVVNYTSVTVHDKIKTRS